MTVEEKEEFARQHSPPCRVCGKAAEVICYPDDHSQTVCPECCDTAEHANGEKGHEWIHDKWEGWYCAHCGIPRNCTQYEEAYLDRG